MQDEADRTRPSPLPGRTAAHRQLGQIDALVRAALQCRPSARNGLAFASRPGLALVNAIYDLTGVDALYDLAADVAFELREDRHGNLLGNDGEPRLEECESVERRVHGASLGVRPMGGLKL